jgi:hypothetical protein
MGVDPEARDLAGQLSASTASERAAAVACSTIAAFCWVTPSIADTAMLTSCSPLACFSADLAIFSTSVLISAIWPMIRSSALPVSLTRLTPASTCSSWRGCAT